MPVAWTCGLRRNCRRLIRRPTLRCTTWSGKPHRWRRLRQASPSASTGGPQTSLSVGLQHALSGPESASALAYAVLLGQDEDRDAQIRLLQADAASQAALVTRLAGEVSALPKSARLPLLDLAMPALRQMAPAERTRFLATVDALIQADQRVTLAEFVVQTVLERRLDPKAGRATTVKFNSMAAAAGDCAVLLSLVAHVAEAAGNGSALDGYLRGMAMAPEAGLSVTGLALGAGIDFVRVRAALGRLTMLAPLQKPLLVKMLMAAGSLEGAQLDINFADLIRAICAAVDAPVPPAVMRTYMAIAGEA